MAGVFGRSRFRPCFDLLEDRIVPAAYTFRPPAVGLPTWNNPAAWVNDAGGPAPGPNGPGSGDTVTIARLDAGGPALVANTTISGLVVSSPARIGVPRGMELRVTGNA